MIKMDIEKYILLLDDNNIYIRENASEYLYPFFPKKCLSIMEDYSKTLKKDVDKITIDSKIRGLKRKDAFFFDFFKKLYDTDDLSSLNRENSK